MIEKQTMLIFKGQNFANFDIDTSVVLVLIVDEVEVAKQKYINAIVGSLDAPNQTFLVDCYPLDGGSNVNCSIILHSVDNMLRQLEIKRESFLLFLTDASRYMVLRH